MKQLLVPTDFSPIARHALAAAVQLARPLEGRITLLHAVELPPAEDLLPPADPPPEVFIMKLLQAAKQQFQFLLREAALHATEVTIQELMQVAPRRSAILTAFTQQHPDMVVIGTDGALAPLGATAEWLVRTAPCPVLVVHYPLGFGPVQTIVWSTDFSVLALRAGQVLRELQALFPAAVFYVLHVSAPGEPTETLRTQLAHLVQQLGLAGCELAVVAATSLRGGIAHFAQQVQANIVVLRVSAAGAGWLWPAPEASTAPALPPVLTFRLEEEIGAASEV